MYTYFGAFALMISGFFVVFGQEIAVFLFGEGFRFSGYMLQYAAPFLVFNCWATISLNILAGLGKIKQRLGIVTLALGINILLNLIFLIFLGKGLLFSAMILSVSWMVMALGAMWIIGKAYPFTLDWKFLMKNVVIIGILCGVMWGIKGEITMLGRREMFGVLFGFFVGYGVLLAGINWRKVKVLVKEIKTTYQ
ncbi:MAG: polysaccharide biosynthesis C-terminal domain-containing protein [Candidatus Peribacteria bacterium]|jgi:O-antigen/teichoic acid export membrane protein|nr:polysaccharide biosynthesis C-terminal domain-containing protein [Candidatus Peribacteria bacterium]